MPSMALIGRPVVFHDSNADHAFSRSLAMPQDFEGSEISPINAEDQENGDRGGPSTRNPGQRTRRDEDRDQDNYEIQHSLQ